MFTLEHSCNMQRFDKTSIYLMLHQNLEFLMTRSSRNVLIITIWHISSHQVLDFPDR